MLWDLGSRMQMNAYLLGMMEMRLDLAFMFLFGLMIFLLFLILFLGLRLFMLSFPEHFPSRTSAPPNVLSPSTSFVLRQPAPSRFRNRRTPARSSTDDRFGMQDCNPAKAPFSDTTQLHKRRDDEEPADETLYREIVGSLGYLPTYTRPDLSFAVSKLSQYLSDPSGLHMQAAKHVLRYLNGSLDLGILSDPEYGHSQTPLGYTDASHAADPDDRKSHSGNIFFHIGGSISHSSGKQRITALSSMESEYIETMNAAQEAIFLRKLYASINAAIQGPMKLLTDSEAARNHVRNNVQHSRTKHIDTRFHYIREVHNAGLVDLEHVPAADQVADVLTKPLGITKHVEAIKQLRLAQFPFDRR
jgi:hypothetical protein